MRQASTWFSLATLATFLPVEAAREDSVAAAVAPYFQPFQTEVSALAPDGRYLAFDDSQDAGVAIVLLDLADLSSRRFVLSERSWPRNGVVQLMWLSPTRLAFSMRSRALGLLDAGTGAVRPLLDKKQLARFQPDPILSPRRDLRATTPDMPGDTTTGAEAYQLPDSAETVEVALVDSGVYGDLFSAETRNKGTGLLVPFLADIQQDEGHKLLVEARIDLDPLDDIADEIHRLVVPGNVVLYERGMLPPSDLPTNAANYGQYQVVVPLPPLLLLELDAEKKRQKVLLERKDWLRVLTDRQGRPRLALEADGIRRRYLYRAADSGKWVPLERVVKDEAAAGFAVTPKTILGPRSIPLGFDYDGTTLYHASNVGRDTFALQAIDMTSGRPKDVELAIERADLVEPTDLLRDDVLVFDPHLRRLVGVRMQGALNATVWLDGELGQIQAALSRQLAPRRCRLLEWDAQRHRFLVDVADASDPGGFYVFDRTRNRLYACAPRATWLTEDRLNVTHAIAFTAPDGRKLSGHLTVPRQPRLDPSPVLVYFHDGPWFCDPPAFNRGVQALAGLGFAVLQLNYRGSAGLGREHLTAIQSGWDHAVMEDMDAALAWMAGRFPVNPEMVATLGNGFGGYLAVRAAQLLPDRVRCAVAINAPYDLDTWSGEETPGQRFRTAVRRQFFGPDREALRASSALRAGPTTRRPVLVVHAAANAYVPVSMGRALARALKQGAPASSYLELSEEGHGGWSEDSMARLFSELGRFFNSTIYDYSVEEGPATIATAE